MTSSMLSERVQVDMNSLESTCIDAAHAHTVTFAGIRVICLQSVFPSAPFTSVTSFTSSPHLLSHERQSITAY